MLQSHTKIQWQSKLEGACILILSESLVKELHPPVWQSSITWSSSAPTSLQVSPPSSVSGYCQRLFTVRLW